MEYRNLSCEVGFECSAASFGVGGVELLGSAVVVQIH
jgi:hypothetical protein